MSEAAEQQLVTLYESNCDVLWLNELASTIILYIYEYIDYSPIDYVCGCIQLMYELTNYVPSFQELWDSKTPF